MRELIEPSLAVIGAPVPGHSSVLVHVRRMCILHSAVAHSAKRKVWVAPVEEGVIDAHSSREGVVHNILYLIIARGKQIERQWLLCNTV